MNAKHCSISKCICGITLRDGALMVGITMSILSIIRFCFAVINVCSGRNEGWYGILLELINFPLALMLVHAVLKEKVQILEFWVSNTATVAVATFVFGCLIIATIANISDGVASLTVAIMQTYFVVVVRSFAFSLQIRPGII